MALRTRNVSGAFEKQAPGQGHFVVFLDMTLYSHSALSSQVYKWVPAILLLGTTLRWSNILSREGQSLQEENEKKI